MSFRFKQFYIDDSSCSMKVGTDGVLLGAWTPLPDKKDNSGLIKVLDIGTGSGLIALMIAQRDENAVITAIDIDTEASKCAKLNFERSKWSDRLSATNIRLQAMPQEDVFDLIVSNPPYFTDSLKAPDKQRSIARHTDTLSFYHIYEYATNHLSVDGLLSLILPADIENEIISAANKYNLYPNEICRVHTTPAKRAKRIMICFSKKQQSVKKKQLILSSDGTDRSAAYQELTHEFYL